MPRAKLSDVSLKQLVAELERRKSRLADLLDQRDAIAKEIEQLEALGFVPAFDNAPVAAARRGRPAGKRGRESGAVRAMGKTLAEYVKETLAAATKGLSVTEIEQRILASEYPTKAKRLYKQVMAVLGRGGFKKVARGVYQLAGAARQAGRNAMKAATQALAKTPAKGKGGRKRGQFAQTAQQLILGLVKGRGATTADINRAWKAAGRAGKADVALARMFKAGKLKREKLKVGKGSTYTVA